MERAKSLRLPGREYTPRHDPGYDLDDWTSLAIVLTLLGLMIWGVVHIAVSDSILDGTLDVALSAAKLVLNYCLFHVLWFLVVAIVIPVIRTAAILLVPKLFYMLFSWDWESASTLWEFPISVYSWTAEIAVPYWHWTFNL